jgi:outer membrane receptor protein involved in Fe transport
VSEEVTVTGVAPLVESTSGVIRETVDRVRVSELPLNGRNVLQLQVLIPGSVSGGSLDQGAGTPGYAVNGGIAGSNMYSLDGGEYQDAYFNAPLPFPNPDAIQEFTIQTNSYSAEFGRNRGASINAVTKSGSNEFHGGAFEVIDCKHVSVIRREKSSRS